MGAASLLFIVAVAAQPQPAAACAPESLTRIVTRDVTPSIPTDHFARQPRVIYRLGADRARVEEAPNPVTRAHVLVVVNTPDIWMVNLADKTGRHTLDPGPTYEVRTPLFTGRTIPRLMSQLEFGCEGPFARTYMTPQADVTVDGRTLKGFTLVENTFRLQLLLDAAGRPTEARLFQDEKPMMVLAYDAYETGLPDDPALFARPAGVAFTSTPPAHAAPPAP